MATPAISILEDMTKTLQLQFYRSSCFRQLGALCIQMHAKCVPRLSHYNSDFDISDHCDPQLRPEHHMFSDRPPARMTASACLGKMSLTGLMLETFRAFQIIIATLDNVTVDETGIYSTFQVDSVTCFHCNVQKGNWPNKQLAKTRTAAH